MTQQPGAASIALLLILSTPAGAQNRVLPQAVRFQGAPEYTAQELLAAAGVRPGTRLTAAEVKARARQLNDTGLFKEVRFSSERGGLVFTLTPSAQLYPVHLENLPLTPGKELEAGLHDRLPLYHGLLPAAGSMVNGVARTLEQMLAAQGVRATVKAALTSGVGPRKITAVSFTVVSPSVRIGRIQTGGISPAMEAKAAGLVSGQTGGSFDTENTAAGLQRAFEDLYHDQGYAAVHVEVARVDPPAVSDQSIDVPFSITIREGGIYRLGAIDLPPDALVTRAEIQRTLYRSPGRSGRPLDLFVLAVRDAYTAQGYLDCAIDPRPSFNEGAHLVSYSLGISPGPQYRLASVQFDGAPEAMAARLRLAWKMASGDVFDERYLSTFAAAAQKKDRLLSRWIQTVITTYDFKADPDTHEVRCVFHFARAAQGPA